MKLYLNNLKIILIKFLKSNRINLTKKYYYLFGAVYVFYIYSFYFNYLDWSGDYALYILQARSLESGSFNNLVEKVNLSFMLSKNSVPYSPDYYPFGLSIIFLITSKLHNWNILYLKLLNPITLVAIFFLLIKSTKLKKSQDYLLTLLCVVIANNLLFFSNLQPSLVSSFFIVLSYLCFDNNKKNISILFFLIACVVRTNSVIFIVYFIINQKFKENISYFLKMVFIFATTYFTAIFHFKFNIFGYYKFVPIYEQKRDLLSFQYFYSKFVDFLIKLSELLFFVRLPEATFIGLFIFSILIYLFFKNRNFLVILFFLFFSFFINYFIYLIDLKRIITPIIFVSLYFASKIKFNKFSIFFVGLFIIYNLFTTFLNIQNIEKSQNVLTEEFYEVVNVINKNYENEIIGFNKPRVLMLYSNVLSYKLTKENSEDIQKNGLVLCNKNFIDCPIFLSETVFENEDFEIIKYKNDS